MNLVRTLRIAGLFAALALMGAGSARAEFDILISAPTLGGLGGSIDINVFDPTLNNSSDPNVITVNTTNLNAALTASNAGFVFDTLGVSKVPVDGGTAQLNISGTIRTVTGGAAVPVTITASAIDYTLPPAGVLAEMSSTTSDSFSGGFGGKTFQSFYDAGNKEFATTTPSPVLTLAAASGTNSDNATASVTSVGVLPNGYSLTNTSIITLGAVGSSDLFTGVTTIRAVPEPGSIALMLLGGTAIAARLRRRKAQA